MKEEFIVCDYDSFLHIKLKGAKFARQSLLIVNSPFRLQARIDRAKKKLAEKEKILSDNFVGTW